MRATLDPFPDLRINEVLANNQTGSPMAAATAIRGSKSSTQSAPTALDGFYLANTYANLAQWPFPAGSALTGDHYQVVWADGEPAETGPDEWHTSFRLQSPAGVVVLSRLQNGQPAVVDFLEYSGLSADRAFGYVEPRMADAAPGLLPQPSPGQPNLAVDPPQPEIVSIATSDAGQVTLVWTTAPGWTYRVEARSTIDSSPWELRGTIVASSGEAEFTDVPPADLEACYYRVTVAP